MTGHNYYLYLHHETRKFTWIPWDLNEAFGGFGSAGSAADQMNLSLDRSLTNASILADRLLQMPVMKARYHEIVRGQLATNFNAGLLFPLIDAMTATIRSSLVNDPMVSLPEFDASLSELSQPEKITEKSAGQSDLRPGGMSGPGGPRQPRAALKAFINQRATSARQQLEGKTNGYVPRAIRPGPEGGP